MPDADGRIPPVFIKRVPWKDYEEEDAQLESARDFDGYCPDCGLQDCICPDPPSLDSTDKVDV